MAILSAPLKPGVSVTTDQCLAAQCSVQGLSVDQLYVCSYNGYAGAKAGCTDPSCAAYLSQLNCGTPTAGSVVQPTYTAPTTTTQDTQATQQTTQAAPSPEPTTPAPGGQAATVQVQTDAGPALIPVEQAPAVSDVGLAPSQPSIPNIWDSLDPTKISQFAYRGPAATLPVWVGSSYRQYLANQWPAAPPGGGAAPAAAAAAASLPAGGSQLPVWVIVLVVGGAALMFSGQRTPFWLGRRKRRKR